MTPAQIGPATSAFEAVATAVGAGVLLGGVAVGVVGMASGWPRRRLAERSLTDGYLGGVVGAVVLTIDLLIRYLL
jgi:hypothetical protein